MADDIAQRRLCEWQVLCRDAEVRALDATAHALSLRALHFEAAERGTLNLPALTALAEAAALADVIREKYWRVVAALLGVVEDAQQTNH